MCFDKSTATLFSPKYQEFKKLCEDLALDGQILLLKDKIQERSLILLDTQKILSETFGKLVHHERVSSNTGVVCFSKMESHFPDDTSTLLKCLCLFEYCFEVHDELVLKNLLKQNKDKDRYYFFPDHISPTRSAHTIPWDESKSGKFCWILNCEEFFSPKFVQLLIASAFCIWFH